MRRAWDILRQFLTSHWGISALVAFCLVQHWDLLAWAVPASGDHMIHMYKGWLMADQLIPSGRVTGWSNTAFAGYPAALYYPALGDMLVAATRWVTLGLMSWERTYAVFFFALLVAIAVCVYVVARRIAGQLGALVAAALHLGDVGGWPQGGHWSTYHFAVWPVVRGMILTMFSVVACEGAITRPIRERPLRFLGFVVLLAGALLGHPMGYFYLGLSAPLVVIVVAIAGRASAHPLRVIGRAALAGIAALVLASFWIVPWLTTGGEWTLGWPAVGFGGAWYSLPRMVERLASNKLFDNFYWVAWALGGLGLVPALLSRKRWPTYLALLLIAAFVFTGVAAHLGEGLIVRKAQIERMAAFLKLLWFVLAGYAVDRGVAAIDWGCARAALRWPRLGAGLGPLLRSARPFAAAGLVAAIIAVGWEEHYDRIAVQSEKDRLGGELWPDIVRANAWIGRQPHGPLDRVLYQPGKLCVKGNLVSAECNEIYHQHLFAASPIWTGLPKLKFGYEATAIFNNLPLAHRWPYDTELIQRLLTQPEALETLHVRWLVSLVEWPRRPDVELVKRFGDVWVYSVEAGKAPPVSIEGPGTIDVLAFEDERVVVRVAGAGEGSRLHYPIAYFYPWRAYRDGRELTVTRHGVLPGVRKILMTVEARDGITELLYVRPPLERAANWASLFGWIACVTLAGVVLARRLARRPGRRAAERT
ncbi:MAG: hypothetical protein M0R80_22220 [Proteobacteria bacterium]|jgi:hypothetical protein|nr:hypothetical protein [Pseudomonadota bacterium]